MKSADKKIIGLVIEDIFTDFSKEIINSVVHAMHDRDDLDLMIFAGRQDELTTPRDKQHFYKTVYNYIYCIEEKCPLDGLIITLPNMKGIKYDKYKNVPKVFIASDSETELTVNYDDAMGIHEALHELVEVRKFDRLCMLGGREDNADAQKRKEIFSRYLSSKGIEFTEMQYEVTDMNVKSEAAATRLLDNNPDVQAIFCVNDQVACGLYEVMQSRNLVPGKDVIIFGFDNTGLATELMPPLASIGSDAATLGQSALDLLLQSMKGEMVKSVVVPTCLYGRESMIYDNYNYSKAEMLNADLNFINKMFDDCFYRYRNEIIDSKVIDLRKLFIEFISYMLKSAGKRHIDEKEYENICRYIDIFFDNGAMEYTDVTKFLRSIDRFQGAINTNIKSRSANAYTNRMFLRMKDRALLSLAKYRNYEKKEYGRVRAKTQEFITESMNFGTFEENPAKHVIDNFDKLGLVDAEFYMFDKRVEVSLQQTPVFPETIRLKCKMKGGKTVIPSAEGVECKTENIYNEYDGGGKAKRIIAFPVFSGKYIYGILICNITTEILDKGEFVAGQLGNALYLSDKNKADK
ncbi:MAG: LacI family transcriptional regulator [Lachnospiraceae bacterium]|nr:LacI family transcriptional regulator [Lachnospiraceae bacterium]